MIKKKKYETFIELETFYSYKMIKMKKFETLIKLEMFYSYLLKGSDKVKIANLWSAAAKKRLQPKTMRKKKWLFDGGGPGEIEAGTNWKMEKMLA